MAMKGLMRRILLVFLFTGIPSLIFAQNFILQPPAVENDDGEFKIKLLLKQENEFRLTWTQATGDPLNLNGTGARLVIGRSANTYNAAETALGGTNADLIPANIPLSAGRYYARITNSTARTAAGMQEDFEANPQSILYSNEILLLIEANEAPAVTAPRGTISNSSPTFQWTAISGVPSYWLILSSTPFDIVEDENGDIAIEGATIVWQYITKSTTADYGAINRDSPFTDEAPPLNSGQEYSFTVLNVYEDNNPVFTSPVFGGIVPFTYVDPNAVPRTELQAPANEETFFSEETLTFEWSEIPEATNYTINLLQIVKQQGLDVTIPIWTSTTTNTLIEYPALENLKNGVYQWNVITNNSSGGGSTSASRFFTYKVETGEFGSSIRSVSDNSVLLGVEVTARAVSGGVTPTIPFFVQTATHFDSLVAGTYEFTATKEGFENTSGRHTIQSGRTTNFTLSMKALPSSIKGLVQDESGENVENAIVQVTGVSNDVEEQTTTSVNGEFSISLDQGTYEIEVLRSGYISPEIESYTVGLNDQLEIDEPFVITNDQATVSGTVFNDEGVAIQRARLLITDGENQYETNTNGSGQYQFTVASGNWSISAEKIGFVKPADQSISLSTGDVLQGQDFTLTGNANQITGFVREQIVNEDGSTGSSIFEGVLVTAIPNVGNPISTRTGRNGQYTLSLKSGSYSIKAVEENYTTSEDRELVIGIAVGETISGMDFELIPNPSSLSGTVTLPDGNGVSDAIVSVEGVGSTRTSSSGFYEISVSQATHRVTVSKTGLVSPSARTVTVSAGQELTGVNFEMTPNAGTVSGTITSGGEALSNTTLTAINAVNGNTAVLTNNLNGTYSFNLRSGQWYIKAVKQGFLSDSTETLSVGPGQQLVNQNFSLTENLTTVRGTVIDGANPVRNARITVTRADGTTFNQSTVTQINGTYAFSLPAGKSYQITATKDGYKTSTFTTVSLVPSTTVIRDFSLSANPSSVAGTVRINGGNALGNAKIVALRSDNVREDSTTTKTDGTYLLGLNPGNYTLLISKAGYTRESLSTSLSIGQKLTGVNATVDENFVFVSGSLFDSDENPVEQVFVNLTRNGAGGASTTTDQEGGFSFNGLIGGNYTIEYSKSGFVTKRITRTVADGVFLNLSDTLTAKNGSISGTIQDENGIVLDDASVTAVSDNGTEYTAITDANGNYSLTSLEIASYEINAAKTGYTSSEGSSAVIAEGALNVSNVNVNNLIPNNGIIRGTITNFATNDAIKEVEISAVGVRGSGFTISAANGSYELSNLIPDTYELVSSKEGFKSDTTSVVIDPANPVTQADREIIQNNGTISGVVTNPKGEVLPFRVTLVASGGNESYTTQSNGAGEFTFEGVETGVTYDIVTDIYREGYENVETVLTVPVGSDEVELSGNLEVIVSQGKISGNSGVANASVKLLDAQTNQILDLKTASADGSYTFDFLNEGGYKVVAQLLGYTFNPDTSNVLQVAFNGTQTQSFTAQANIASLTVEVVDDASVGVSNVDVTIISADTTIILARKTNESGIATFSNIKATTFYVVRPEKDGFTASPESREISLSSGEAQTTRFTLSANNASMVGVVKSTNNSGNPFNLREATVRAVFNSTGQSITDITDRNGQYSFENIAPGSYSIIVSNEGFVNDTLAVTVVAGSETQIDEITLSRAFVDVRGLVKLKGEGVEGVKVEALSTASFETTTNESGSFRFANLPIKTGAADTTVYQIKITSGVFTKSYIVELRASQIGRRVNVDQTNLPSGKIELTVTDGVDPLSGASLEFGISGGESERIVTGNDGSFESSENLRRATYVVAVAKQGLLVPQNTIRIALPSDTTVLERDIILPYRLATVNDILADEPTKVSVVNRAGYNNTRASGKLFYKKASDNVFTSVNLQQNGDSLQAFIPALNSTEELTFYTSVFDSVRDNNFVSNQRVKVPLASGILTNIRVTPTVAGQKLRVGDRYTLSLFVRDGINKSLLDDFTGENATGTVSWSLLSDSTGVTLQNQVGTGIQLVANEVGTYVIRVSASLDGSIISRNLTVDVTDIPLEEIVVSSPGKQLANSSNHLFGYAAIDTSGATVLLGESLRWSVNPSSSGEIDNRGVFTPANSNLVGIFKIMVSDSVSGLNGISDAIELIARVEPDESYTLINGNGLELALPEGSVDIPSQVSLTEATPAPTKKFVFAQGSDQSYTVGDRIYILSFAGSSLKKTAQLTLPNDSTISELSSGDREVGRFNFTTLQWEVLENLGVKSISNATGRVETARLGQFAVLAANEPLGLRHAAVLPSPFSPDIAPVKIGYWLDTAFPPAKVTIKIYNIRGELVRTLLEDDLQQPGRYGSASSAKEITWDGLTDGGNMARNGRYVIQITAEDQQDEVVKLLQVVLIK